MNVQETIIDLTPGVGIEPVLECSQFDSDNSRRYVFKVRSNGTPVVFDGTESVVIIGTKPDKKSFAYGDEDGVTVVDDTNEIVVPHMYQMGVVAGNVKCELRITTDNTTIATRNFTLHVEKSPVPDDADISLSEVDEYTQAAKQAALIAEAEATDASNAAYTAGTAATSASNSAGLASEKATIASTSAGNAETAKNNAAQSALASSASAEAAAISATEARQAAEAAAQIAGVGEFGYYIGNDGFLHFKFKQGGINE